MEITKEQIEEEAKVEKERLDDMQALNDDLDEQRTAPSPEHPPVVFQKDQKHQVETILSHWENYIPDWLGATTNPKILNGVLRGRFVKQGNTVFLQIRMVAGSNTTYGSGQWFFKLPFPTARHDFKALGSAYLVDSGTTKSIGVALALSGDDKVSVQTHSSANPVKSDTPWTWASGDELHVELVYETS